MLPVIEANICSQFCPTGKWAACAASQAQANYGGASSGNFSQPSHPVCFQSCAEVHAGPTRPRPSVRTPSVGILVASLPPPEGAFETWRLIVDRPGAWSSAILKLFVNHGGKFDPAADDPYLPQVLAGLGPTVSGRSVPVRDLQQAFRRPQLPQHSQVQSARCALQDSRQA